MSREISSSPADAGPIVATIFVLRIEEELGSRAEYPGWSAFQRS